MTDPNAYIEIKGYSFDHVSKNNFFFLPYFHRKYKSYYFYLCEHNKRKLHLQEITFFSKIPKITEKLPMVFLSLP